MSLVSFCNTDVLNPLRASDALRHYRLIPDNALRHFSDGTLDSPVMDRFPALCSTVTQIVSFGPIINTRSINIYNVSRAWDRVVG